MNVEIIANLLIKTFFMNLGMELIIIKTLNYKDKKIELKTAFIIMLLNIIYACLRNLILIHKTVMDLIIYFLIGIYIINKMDNRNVFVVIFALSFNYISYLLAITINFSISEIKFISSFNNGFVSFIIIGIIQLSLIILFFKIKRFRYGLSFLKRDNYNKRFNYLGFIISISIIIMCLMYTILTTKMIATTIVLCMILGGIIMFQWIKYKITEHYKAQMKDRTVEIQKNQLKEKDEIISNLKEELASVLQINHKYSHRISAAQNAVVKFGEKIKAHEEYAEEYADILDNIKKLSDEYKSENMKLNDSNDNLSKTNIYSIDNLLNYLKEEATKNNINMKMKLNVNLNLIVDNIISKSRIETLLGDHIKDAIIAINYSNNTYREILIVFDIVNEYYELKIFDTGIEFEIDTLLKLGLEYTTTHKEDGGSGIGFMTTFETLRETKASLIIEEKHKMQSDDYTKAVIIRFDEKTEYKIRSYRAEKIEKLCNDNRIIIEKI